MIYELRIYRAMPGRMPALLSRFREDTLRIFERHGIRSIAYWTNAIGGRNDELWYILAFDDLAHRDRAWAEFRADVEWQQVAASTQAEGPLVEHIENRIITLTDFSPALG